MFFYCKLRLAVSNGASCEKYHQLFFGEASFPNSDPAHRKGEKPSVNIALKLRSSCAGVEVTPIPRQLHAPHGQAADDGDCAADAADHSAVAERQ